MSGGRGPEDEYSEMPASRWRYVRQPEPRFFDQPTAAAYLGISERLFETQWRAYNLPYPRKIGRRCLWDRKVLDHWADVVSGIAKGSESADGAPSALDHVGEAYDMSPTFPRKKRPKRPRS